MDVAAEVERRQAQRDTFLSYYAKHGKEQPNKICSLMDLQRSLVSSNECDLAYVFVMGSCSNETTCAKNLVGKDGATTIERDPLEGDDGIFLNIEENMNEGKSESWFKHASTLADKMGFDYIAKTDTDTVVHPLGFFRFVNSKLQPSPGLVYGGLVSTYRKQYAHLDDQQRGTNGTIVESYLQATGGKDAGIKFFQGQFYMLSLDLARYITTSDYRKNHVRAGHIRIPNEDVEIGRLVWNLPNSSSVTRVQFKDKLWEHGLKDPLALQEHWKDYLACRNVPACTPAYLEAKRKILDVEEQSRESNMTMDAAMEKALYSMSSADGRSAFLEILRERKPNGV
jgi:hypothetical protein